LDDMLKRSAPVQQLASPQKEKRLKLDDDDDSEEYFKIEWHDESQKAKPITTYYKWCFKSTEINIRLRRFLVVKALASTPEDPAKASDLYCQCVLALISLGPISLLAIHNKKTIREIFERSIRASIDIQYENDVAKRAEAHGSFSRYVFKLEDFGSIKALNRIPSKHAGCELNMVTFFQTISYIAHNDDEEEETSDCEYVDESSPFTSNPSTQDDDDEEEDPALVEIKRVLTTCKEALATVVTMIDQL
jgi:hypothetical protein